MSLRLTLITAALALVSALASAQAPNTATPRVDARQAKQERRIEQGVASGQLTARETLRVEREQKRIATVEARAEGDGKVTVQERKRLHHLQNAASRDIRRQKHDAQTAPLKP
jgi:hypothetical protein